MTHRVTETLDDPLISVVTVCMNSAATLERTIRSVAGQTYKHIEYVIVDGGSTDTTLEIIERHEATITRWISEPDGGIYDAMDKGIGLATGELIILVNADDFLETEAAVKETQRKLDQEKWVFQACIGFITMQQNSNEMR